MVGAGSWYLLELPELSGPARQTLSLASHFLLTQKFGRTSRRLSLPLSRVGYAASGGSAPDRNSWVRMRGQAVYEREITERPLLDRGNEWRTTPGTSAKGSSWFAPFRSVQMVSQEDKLASVAGGPCSQRGIEHGLAIRTLPGRTIARFAMMPMTYATTRRRWEVRRFCLEELS